MVRVQKQNNFNWGKKHKTASFSDRASLRTPRLRTIIFILKLRKQFHKAEWLVQGYAASQWQSQGKKIVCWHPAEGSFHEIPFYYNLLYIF